MKRGGSFTEPLVRTSTSVLTVCLRLLCAMTKERLPTNEAPSGELQSPPQRPYPGSLADQSECCEACECSNRSPFTQVPPSIG